MRQKPRAKAPDHRVFVNEPAPQPWDLGFETVFRIHADAKSKTLLFKCRPLPALTPWTLETQWKDFYTVSKLELRQTQVYTGLILSYHPQGSADHYFLYEFD